MIKGMHVQIQGQARLTAAIAKGRIKRQPCCVCGDPKSEGHHEDYTKPLDVIWLCAKHHSEAHMEHDAPVKHIKGVLKYRTAVFLSMLPTSPAYIGKSLGLHRTTVDREINPLEGTLVESKWNSGLKTIYLTEAGQREMSKALLAYGKAEKPRPVSVESLAKNLKSVWEANAKEDPWLAVAKEIEAMYGEAILRTEKLF